MVLNEQQLERLKKDNQQCPYCGSIVVLEVEWKRGKEAGQVNISVLCDTCRKGWTEEYTLTGVDGKGFG